jgi:di/tricarboxylate transporter
MSAFNQGQENAPPSPVDFNEDIGARVLGLTNGSATAPHQGVVHEKNSTPDDYAFISGKDESVSADVKPRLTEHRTTAVDLLYRYWGLPVFLVVCLIGLGLLGGLAFKPLSWKAWFTFAVICVTLGILLYEIIAIEVGFLLAVTVLLAFQVITPAQSLTGFSDTGVATVAVLYAVAEGINRTNGLNMILRILLGKPKYMWVALMRLVVPMAALSAFVHNTPLVAMAFPIIQSWCRRRGFPASQFLMPMNVCVLLGGLTTILGTSTNLIILGLVTRANLKERSGTLVTLSMFRLAPVGVALSIVGIVYCAIFTRFLLKDRGHSGVEAMIENPREYTIAIHVQDRAPIVGESILEAGLRRLKGLYLIDITRKDGELVPAVSPETKIMAGDTLLFAGIVETVAELYQIEGLVPATTQSKKVEASVNRRRLVEIVISNSSSLRGMTPREAKFRTQFGAAIIAVHRHGDHVRQKIADIVLEGGDTLLVETRDDFVDRFGNHSEFALVSEVSGSQPKREDYTHMAIAILIMVVMTAVASSQKVALLTCTAVAAFLMVATGCCSVHNAAKAIDMHVMLTIAASFGLANGLSVTGGADALATFILNIFRKWGVIGSLLGIFFSTSLLTNLITNNAAAALMYPIVESIIKKDKSLDTYAAIYTLMVSSSCSFSTPIGYQTNMMVHGPGGYKFGDWVKFGVPLQIIIAFPTVFLIHALFHSNP